MSVQNRETLKKFFKKGQLPSEKHFNDLIDSIINKVDDGMTKTVEEGLMLYPIGNSEKISSFYKNIEEKSPVWSFEIDGGDGNMHIVNGNNDPVLSLDSEHKVGINQRVPEHTLDINGTVAFQTKVGTKYQGKVLADGKWHPIIENLNGCHAFEIMAGVGKKKTGKYALAHAIALSTFGKSKNKIKVNQAYYGIRSNKIQFRWTGSIYDFTLEMRTKVNYRGDFFINYNITELWEDHFMDHSVELLTK